MNKQRQHVLVWPLVALLAIGALVIISVSAQSTSGASFAKPSFTLNVDPGTPISGGGARFHTHRSVRRKGVAALLSRQGRDPRLQ